MSDFVWQQIIHLLRILLRFAVILVILSMLFLNFLVFICLGIYNEEITYLYVIERMDRLLGLGVLVVLLTLSTKV